MCIFSWCFHVRGNIFQLDVLPGQTATYLLKLIILQTKESEATCHFTSQHVLVASFRPHEHNYSLSSLVVKKKSETNTQFYTYLAKLWTYHPYRSKIDLILADQGISSFSLNLPHVLIQTCHVLNRRPPANSRSTNCVVVRLLVSPHDLGQWKYVKI